MSSGAPDYTSRDFETLLERVKRLTKSMYPNWTDYNVANFANSLLQSFSFIGDVLSYYTDFQALESLPEFAQLRRAVQAHAAWIGYELRGRTAATVELTLTAPNGVAHGRDIPIYSGYQFSTTSPNNPRMYQILADSTFPAGDVTHKITVENSETVQEERVSTGRASQIFLLEQDPYIDGTIEIEADNGAYTLVDRPTMASAKATDRYCRVEVDDEVFPVVRFGDGVNGQIPSGTIVFTYRVGGGLDGRVDAGDIDQIVDDIVDDLGVPVTLTVTNASDSSGGDDEQTLSEAKSAAITSLKTRSRTVTKEDFVLVAEDVDGVARALILTAKDTPQVPENQAVVYLVAEGTVLDSGRVEPAVPTQLLTEQVEDAWKSLKPHLMNFYPSAVGTSGTHIKRITIICTVYLHPSADLSRPTPSSNTVIGDEIIDRVRDFFAALTEEGIPNADIDFGQNITDQDGTVVSEIAWSDVLNVINDTEDVRKVDPQDLSLNSAVDNVSLNLWDFPAIDAIEIINGENSEVIGLYTHTP